MHYANPHTPHPAMTSGEYCTLTRSLVMCFVLPKYGDVRRDGKLPILHLHRGHPSYPPEGNIHVAHVAERELCLSEGGVHCVMDDAKRPIASLLP